jgi:kumamolisin
MRLPTIVLALALALPLAFAASPAEPSPATVARPDSLPPIVADAIDLGPAPDALPLHVVIGLELREKAALDAFLADVSDPASPDHQRFLTQDEFNALYGPTEEQEARVAHWLTGAGFVVRETFPNHLLVGATGDNAAAQRAFGVTVHNVLYDGQLKHAALDAPLFPVEIAKFTTGVSGLDDLAQMRPMHGTPKPAPMGPKAAVGASCCAFGPNDLKVLYSNSASFTGTGQTEVIAGAYQWKDTDNTAYNNQWGLPALPAGSAQVCAGSGTGCTFDASNSIEVTLDVQMVHAVAPNAVIKNYMSQTTALTDFQTMYNKVVTDNPGHSISSSWGLCEQSMSSAQRTSDDNIFANGAAVGQSWFAASGDSGSADCGGATGVDYPASSPNMMGVGGTHANCSPAMTSSAPNCQAYGSESAWTSGGGGNSIYYAKPSWQTGCSVPTGNRHVPDVSLESDTSPGNYVFYNGAWATVGGTSDAAPMMGGIFSLLNQKLGGTGQGLPGTRLYQLCGGNSFHDVTTGSNGAFSAGVGYDMTTGVGTPLVDNLLNNWAGSPPTVPGAPTLTATAGNAQVALSWTTPSNGGATITSYKVYRGTTSGGEALLTSGGCSALGVVNSCTDTGLTNGQTYYYQVSAVNSVGEGARSAEKSATPTMPTCPGPSNNCFASATAASGTPYSTTQSTTGATMETGEPAPCGSLGASVWFTWTAPGSGTATVSTVSGSTNYDTVLAAYTGTSLTALTNLACNDDFSGTQSQITFTCTAGTSYKIQLGGYQAATGTAGFSISGCPASAPNPTSLNQNFDGGTGVPAGWTFTGLWHVSAACANPVSAPNTLQYNQAASCNYNTGARTSGLATTPAIDISAAAAPTLTFSTAYLKENYAGGAFDVMKVEVKTATGSWTNIWQRDSRNADQSTWTSVSLSLTSYKSTGTQVRFNFDSIDGTSNAFLGWVVDNVVIQ